MELFGTSSFLEHRYLLFALQSKFWFKRKVFLSVPLLTQSQMSHTYLILGPSFAKLSCFMHPLELCGVLQILYANETARRDRSTYGMHLLCSYTWSIFPSNFHLQTSSAKINYSEFQDGSSSFYPSPVPITLFLENWSSCFHSS